MWRRVFAVVLTLVAVLAAGWLALRRADIPYDTLESVYALPESAFMTLDDGLKVHFTDTGPKDRSAVVLVHGFSASLHTWIDWRTELQKRHRVITLDLPGHGFTRADPPGMESMDRFVEVIAEVTAKRGVERFTIAGNSMGGNAAWATALAHPDRVEGLILVDASGWPATGEDRKSAPLIFKLLENPLARAVLKDLDMSALVRSGLKDSYTDQSFVTDELVDRYISLSRAPGHRRTLLALQGQSNRVRATAENMAQIKVPTLIIWGRDDNLIPVSHAQQFADAIAGSELVIYDNVGHLPQEEAAAESVAVAADFLARVEWNATEVEELEPTGDPRLVEDRPVGE